MGLSLYPHQLAAVDKLKNGSILCGGVGSGKSRTALVYYYTKICKGSLMINDKGCWGEMKSPRNLYIITTAKKRDSLEWVKECASVGITGQIIDSWNNIKKYKDVYGAFFIFDEQRVVGYGAWTKAFLNIARKNQWILLSATPGDVWSDYIPVFIANGFYKNKTEFANRHIIYSPFSNYPKIDRYVDTEVLFRHRRDILVTMKFNRDAKQHHKILMADYNDEKYKTVFRDRWDPYENEPIKETGKLFYLMRRVVNEDPSRIRLIKSIMDSTPRIIIFYNFNYELEMLKTMAKDADCSYSEWNGQKHQEIPKGDRWLYFVQYSAGAEGWNCIETNTIVFYSQNYSYRITVQAAGRIDRLNTSYTDLFYYYLRSPSDIDRAIARALSNKRKFNEKDFFVV